jgi:hypothetical protein
MLASIFAFILTSQSAGFGTNLDGLRDYSPAFLFADAVRTARCFGPVSAPYDCTTSVPKGADGWPTTDFGLVVFTGVAGAEGTYKLTLTGKADVSATASSARIENCAYDATKNSQSCDVVVDKDSQLFLQFKNTNGSVKALSLMRPGLAKGLLWNPAALEALKGYRAIRFMDFLNTNNNPIKTWGIVLCPRI